MGATVKYKGSSNSLFTNNVIYQVLGFAVDSGAPQAVVIDDNGRPAATGDLSNPAVWELATAIVTAQVYP